MQQRQSWPASTTLERPLSIWVGKQDEVAGVESDKVPVDGGHAGSDDDGHIRSSCQVEYCDCSRLNSVQI